MKSTLAFFLLFILLCLSACGEAPVTAETEPLYTEPAATEPSVAETEPPVAEPTPDSSSILCREISAWRRIGIALAEIDRTVVFDIPANWKLEKYDDSTYLVLCDGVDVGELCTDAPADAIAIESRALYFNDDHSVELDVQTRRIREGKGQGFRRLFVFYYTVDGIEHCFYMQVDYDQLDGDAAAHIGLSVDVGSRGDVPSIPLEGGNASRKILIAGNNFVRSSAVGTFFDRFLEIGGQPYEAEWVATGTVSIAYYLQDEWISRIRSGEYHAVVMCGLYYEANAKDLSVLTEACRYSSTTLVLFPAHNEKNLYVSLAQSTYSGLNVLHWKNEIQSFIDNGVSKWDLCAKDVSEQSTPLAGYIGAHMLYMAFFGEEPPEFEDDQPLTMKYIRGKLGDDYVRTGVSPTESVSLIFALSPR